MISVASLGARLRQNLLSFLKLNERLDEIRINQGLMLSEINRRKQSTRLQDYEFKVFSQWGEDGIIQRLVEAIDIRNRTFIEFGVEDFFESNCRFLLMKDNWSGFVMDGSERNISRLRNGYFYWRHDLATLAAFVTRENINDLLARSGFGEDLEILSIDLDGNDYHVLEAIRDFHPRILICEFNAAFGPARKLSIPYDPGFRRADGHYSNLYWGASLAAMTHLASKRGYSLVGTNSAGNNAFFVRNDLVNARVRVLTAEEAYAPARFRESRDPQGNLTYLDAEHRLNLLKGLPVIDVESNTATTL